MVRNASRSSRHWAGVVLSGSIPAYSPRQNSSGGGHRTVDVGKRAVDNGEPSFEGCQSIPAKLSGSLDPNRAETCFCCSVSILTRNRPLASMAFQDRDTLVGQNSTRGGSSDSAGLEARRPLVLYVSNMGNRVEMGCQQTPPHR